MALLFQNFNEPVIYQDFSFQVTFIDVRNERVWLNESVPESRYNLDDIAVEDCYIIPKVDKEIEKSRSLVFGYYNYLMDECNGDATESAIDTYLQQVFKSEVQN